MHIKIDLQSEEINGDYRTRSVSMSCRLGSGTVQAAGPSLAMCANIPAAKYETSILAERSSSLKKNMFSKLKICQENNQSFDIDGPFKC